MSAPQLTFPLGLTPADSPARAAAAWFLPGPDAAAWLDALAELARALDVSATTFDLWVIADTGVVAVPAASASARPPRSASASALRAQPYGRLGERLLLPVDAALSPDVTTAELERLLAPEQHLLHPAAGLVQLDASARRTVLDLLAPPASVAGRWRTLELPTAPLRLASIEVEDPPPIEEFLLGGGAGVGESPLSQAPPTPEEKQQQPAPWSTAAAKLVQWATGGPADAKAKSPPETPEQAPSSPSPAPPQKTAPPPGEGLLDRLRSWAQRTLSESDVQSERERELQRLMHLLENDPDEGLRFALPLKGGPSTPAGAAPPTGKLPPRRVDYRPGGAPRGAAGDNWTVDPEVHRRLVERYREVANRELRLGRYRRAAYVFAELLGDLSSAAAALEQGKHYREAAALHRDALKRPLDAARCLERGGLLDEAATIYEAEGKFVEAGDLWGRLERAREAERAYRRAVAARLTQGDPLSAARLLETKLDRPDEALDVLAAAWPDHAQVGLCLEDRLGLLGRLARHEDARRVLADLRQDARRVGRELVLAKAIGASASRYPEAAVQARAADLVRVLAGERLSAPTVGTAEVEALLQVIGRLDPSDRLLSRDVGRLSAQRRKEAAQARARATPLPSTPRRTGWGPIVRAELRLPSTAGFSWRGAELSGDVLWAVGVSPAVPGSNDATARRVVVHRTRLGARPGAGARQGGAWSWAGKEPVLLAASRTVPAAIAVGGQRLGLQGLASADEMPAAQVGTPGWLPDGVRALASNDEGVVWALYDGSSADAGLVLGAFHASTGGALLGTCAVASPNDTTILPLELEIDLDGEVREDPPLLVAGGSRAALANGGNLIAFFGTEPVARQRLERPARDLAILSRPWAIAVSHDDGGRVYFQDSFTEPCRFGEGLHAPRLAFTVDGLLVAMATDEGRVYEVVDGVIEHRGTFQGPGGEILCVRPAGRSREVVVVMKSGTVRVMAITRSD